MSEGMSLDKVTVNLANSFASAQVYVALSRARSPAGLQVVGYEPHYVKVSEAALEFMAQFEPALSPLEEHTVQPLPQPIQQPLSSPLPQPQQPQVSQHCKRWLEWCVDEIGPHTDAVGDLTTEWGQFQLSYSVDASFSTHSGLQFRPKWPEPLSRYNSEAQLGQSNRYYQRYGGDNVITVNVHSVDALDAIDCTTLHHFAGREWQQRLVRPKDNDHDVRIIVTALQSEDPKFSDNLSNISSSKYFDCWHLNPSINGNLTVLKAMGRTSLAFTTTFPTVYVDVSCLQIVDDELDEYTDGASGVSIDLFMSIWREYLRVAGKADSDDGSVPSVFQGRIASMKGCWYMDPALPSGALSYRGSTMCKWTMRNHTPEQLRVEVISFGLDTGPASLNVQHIRVLEPRLADSTVLVRIQQEALVVARTAMCDLESCKKLCWLTGGNLARQTRERLDSGFSLDHELVQLDIKVIVVHCDWSTDIGCS